MVGCAAYHSVSTISDARLSYRSSQSRTLLCCLIFDYAFSRESCTQLMRNPGAHTDRCIMCAHQEGYPHRGPGLVPRWRLSFAKHLGRLPRYVAEVKLLNVAIMRQASCLLFAVANFEKVVRVVGRWLESRTKEGFRGLFPRLRHHLNPLMLLHLDSATSVPRPLEESTKTRGTDSSSQDMRPVESTRCCNNGDNSCAIRSAI
jgi:hypothetical protein